MIEVLIALVVTSVGLLGLAALQATSLKVNHGAYLRAQATLLAHEMADRMRANRLAATSGDYDLTFEQTPTGSGTVAKADLVDWHATLARELPGGDGFIDVAANGLALVRVQWNDARGDTGTENADNPIGDDLDGDGLLEFQLATEI